MAELTDMQFQRIGPIFLDAYNKHWGTDFSLNQRVQPENNSEDYHFRNSQDGDLKIQWTTPPGDAHEKRAVVIASHFFSDLEKRLLVHGFKGLMILLTYKDIPNSKSERTKLIDNLYRLLENARESMGDDTKELKIAASRLLTYSQFAVKYITDIEIVTNPDPNAKLFVGLAYYMASGVPLSSRRAEEALSHKMERYGVSAHDLVLVIHFDMDAYDEDEVEHMRQALAPHPDCFRQVWTIRDAIITGQRVDCVKEQ